MPFQKLKEFAEPFEVCPSLLITKIQKRVASVSVTARCWSTNIHLIWGGKSPDALPAWVLCLGLPWIRARFYSCLHLLLVACLWLLSISHRQMMHTLCTSSPSRETLYPPFWCLAWLLANGRVEPELLSYQLIWVRINLTLKEYNLSLHKWHFSWLRSDPSSVQFCILSLKAGQAADFFSHYSSWIPKVRYTYTSKGSHTSTLLPPQC